MVVNENESRKIEEGNHGIDDKLNIEESQVNLTTEVTTPEGNSQENTDMLSCYYKPMSPPMLRHRKQQASMFEIQPAPEITEVQEICIETGTPQNVKKGCALPGLVSTLPSSEKPTELRLGLTTSDSHAEVIPSSFRETATMSDHHPEMSANAFTRESERQEHKTVKRKISPAVSPVFPNTRRRSVGVLTSPAWGLRTYKDNESKNRTSPSFRRRSVVLPVRHDENNPSPFRKRSLVTPDVKELKSRRNSVNYIQTPSNSAEAVEADVDELNIKREQSNVAIFDDEFEDFRPRLRSRSLGEYRTQAREGVLQRRRRHVHEVDNQKQNRRKSFEVWLSEKERENLKKLHLLSLGKQRTLEEAKKKEERKGKTYEEWLNEKNDMAAVAKEEDLSECGQQGMEERQKIALRRYDKWLMEKDAQALKKEQEMLKQAKLQRIEMKKKYEEKKKEKLKFLTASLFS